MNFIRSSERCNSSSLFDSKHTHTLFFFSTCASNSFSCRLPKQRLYHNIRIGNIQRVNRFIHVFERLFSSFVVKKLNLNYNPFRDFLLSAHRWLVTWCALRRPTSKLCFLLAPAARFYWSRFTQSVIVLGGSFKIVVRKQRFSLAGAALTDIFSRATRAIPTRTPRIFTCPFVALRSSRVTHSAAEISSSYLFTTGLSPVIFAFLLLATMTLCATSVTSTSVLSIAQPSPPQTRDISRSWPQTSAEAGSLFDEPDEFEISVVISSIYPVCPFAHLTSSERL